MSVIRTRSTLVVLLMVGIGLLLSGCPDDTVFFPDDALERAVRKKLQLPFGAITKTELLKLRRLDARNDGVQDLEGLQFAQNLTWLDVSNETSTEGGITDISPLARLQNLIFLDLSHNDIADVAAVAGLSNLGDLLLEGNDVFNIAPIVTNAEGGGLGVDSTLTLSSEPLENADGEILPQVQAQISRLQALGVTVDLR